MGSASEHRTTGSQDDRNDVPRRAGSELAVCDDVRGVIDTGSERDEAVLPLKLFCPVYCMTTHTHSGAAAT